jgi:hypothetical protein
MRVLQPYYRGKPELYTLSTTMCSPSQLVRTMAIWVTANPSVLLETGAPLSW